MNDKIPAISVIIPLYNAEKYIEQCLGSVLNQTLQDFEVVVVDDCSTDNSVAIVESIAPKFAGRLQLIKLKKNSGGAAIPRNTGIRYSRGKYITFIDNDDLFTRNALNEMYSAAEKTNADVIHTEKYLINKNIEEITDNTPLFLFTLEKGDFVNNIFVETESLEERMKLYCQQRFFWHVWGKLFRRDFIIENYIEFPNVIIIDDMLFSFFCLCLAKRYVRIPNVINIYRNRKTSVLHMGVSPQEECRRYVTLLREGFMSLDNFMNHVDFFLKNTEYRSMVLNFFVQSNIEWRFHIYSKMPYYAFNSILNEEFFKDINASVALENYIFHIVNIYYINLLKSQQTINDLQQKILTLQEELKERRR